MCKRIFVLTFLLSFIPVKNILAIENITSEQEDNDFLDSFVDTEYYQGKPQVNVSLYPRYGINFLRSSEEKDKQDFESLSSRNLGLTLAINMPIKFSNFFYSIAFDICSRTLHWNNFKNLHSKNLFVGKKEYNRFVQKDLKKDVDFTRLNFFDFSVLFGLGAKSNVYDHRNGFFLKGLLGVSFFKFSRNVDYKKKDFLLSTKTLNNVPLRNINFLWGVEMGYWRIGLNIMGDFLSTFKEADSKEKVLDLSKNFAPISCTLFFDLL